MIGNNGQTGLLVERAQRRVLALKHEFDSVTDQLLVAMANPQTTELVSPLSLPASERSAPNGPTAALRMTVIFNKEPALSLAVVPTALLNNERAASISPGMSGLNVPFPAGLACR